MSITVERRNGWMILSSIVHGYLVTRKYMGYSIREAKELYRAELRS